MPLGSAISVDACNGYCVVRDVLSTISKAAKNGGKPAGGRIINYLNIQRLIT